MIMMPTLYVETSTHTQSVQHADRANVYGTELCTADWMMCQHAAGLNTLTCRKKASGFWLNTAVVLVASQTDCA